MSSPQKSRSTLLLTLAGIGVATAVLVWVMRTSEDAPASHTSSNPTAEAPKPAQPVVELGPVTVHQSAPELAAQLTRNDLDSMARIEAVNQVLYVYRQGFGGNPSGQNEDIVAAILGENEKRTALLPKDCPAIQGGKLVDEWGTPYWFHSITAKVMEIRSAGPDRDLFTNDDVFVQ
ncbi:hypothetical protein [Verrucomicrobium sp. BvORR106]|uniref:hypothetical protein n=1 Tax=Verrucomicrobium sp. BvORR106 TaxID=1403819 RepID=UPI002240EEC0|nr:hypothetical protein [Verrucomicrobium sp. BvORR106]